MKSFGDELQIAVIGAGGAIGDALVSHMANAASVGTIYALARNCIPYFNSYAKSLILPLSLLRVIGFNLPIFH